MTISIQKFLKNDALLKGQDRQDFLLKKIFSKGKSTAFMLIDGTCRSDAVGVFDLDELDAAPLPLLNPANGEELSPSGAFIINLDTMRESLGERGFKRHFLQPWGRQHSVIVKAKLSARELQRHLRKFLRLQRVDNGKVVYLRFWDARVALPYFTGITNYPGRLAQWLDPRSTGTIEEVLFETDEPWMGWYMRPDIGNVSAAPQAIKAELSMEEISILKTSKLAEFDRRIAGELSARFGELAPDTLGDAVKGGEFSARVRGDAKRWNISSERGVARFAAASVVLGLGFPSDPSVNDDRRALFSANNISESEKLITAQKFIDAQNELFPQRYNIVWNCFYNPHAMSAEEIFHKLYPEWMETLSNDRCKQAINAFSQQSSKFANINLNRFYLASALTGIFGISWPRNPLYQNILDEMCDENSKMPILHQRLKVIDPEGDSHNSAWGEVMS